MGSKNKTSIRSTENNFDVYADGDNIMGRCIENGYISRKIRWENPEDRFSACKLAFAAIIKNRKILEKGKNILVVFDSIDGASYVREHWVEGVYIKMVILARGKADGEIRQLIRKGSVVITADNILAWLAKEKKGASEVIKPQFFFPVRNRVGKYRKNRR